MERLEFLSGKYKEGERIVPGAVQTFQATEAGGGRPVFVHRIPTTGAEAQNGVVRLLSTALLRSEGVRNLVVEVADEDGFCYVVTQNAEQCLLLREWLQLEIDRASGKPAAEQAAPAEKPAAPPAPPKPEPPADNAPGEFSRLFHVSPGAQPAPPAPSPPNRSETGEFTRFFRSGAPPARKPPEAPRQMDRASSSEGIRIPRSSGAVQRPAHAPMTALPQRPSDSGEIRRVTRTETGEFTRLFSTPASSPGASHFPPPAPPKTPFNAMPSPAAAQEPGEYTRIFGTGNSAPPLAQPGPPAPEPPPARPEIFEPGALSAGESLPRGPSEYTRIIGRGSWNQPEPPQTEAAAAAPPAEAPPAAPAAPIPAIKPPAMPKLAVPKVAVPKGAAAAAAMAPAAANKRLVIFLAIIGLLAVILAIAVILLAKR